MTDYNIPCRGEFQRKIVAIIWK